MPAYGRGRLCSALAILLLFPAFASAADLSFGGASSVSVGESISIPVVVSSPAAAINAVSADVSYPTDLLTLKSISKGSLINFWTQEPSFAAAGTASFEGVIFNPGWTGSKATVVSLVFTPKKPGTATISYSRGSVLANDGSGTEVIGTMSSKTLTIAPAPKPVAPAPAAAPVVATPATTTATSTEPVLTAPEITSYTRVVDRDHPFLIVGRTLPGAQIDIILSGCDDALKFSGLSAAGDCAAATSRSTTADSSGFFVLLWSGEIPAGSYSFVVRSTINGTPTPSSDVMHLVAQSVPERTLALLFIDNLALLFAIVLAVAGFIALGFGIFYALRIFWRRMRRASSLAHPMELSMGDSQIDGYMRVLERAASRRELTEEEKELYTAMRSYRVHPDQPLVTRLSWVKKN
jgi:hypothetical protein